MWFQMRYDWVIALRVVKPKNEAIFSLHIFRMYIHYVHIDCQFILFLYRHKGTFSIASLFFSYIKGPFPCLEWASYFIHCGIYVGSPVAFGLCFLIIQIKFGYYFPVKLPLDSALFLFCFLYILTHPTVLLIITLWEGNLF